MRVLPLALEHEAALAAWLADFGAAGEDIPGYFCDRSWDHRTCVEKLAAWARWDDIQEGWVACTTLFGFEGDTLVGNVNIRHALTPALERYGGHIGYSVAPSHRRRGHGHGLLAAGLGLCRSFGIDRALLTCEPTNTGSVRIIEGAGGERIETYHNEEYGRLISRYWVPTAQ